MWTRRWMPYALLEYLKTLLLHVEEFHRKIIYLALTSSELVHNSEIIPAFTEFQINYLAFMAAVQIWFHCCLVCTLQDPSIYKAHLYTLYICTCIVYPQQMTVRISMVVIKHLCVQEGILHNIYIWTWLVQGTCGVFAIPVTSCYKISVHNFRYLLTNFILYANIWLNTPSGLMRQLKMSYNRWACNYSSSSHV
jgi:hypothetical protein